MSLSVERLWQLYYSLEERADGLLRTDENAVGEDGVEAALALRNDLIDAMHAIRELIAIKEQKPVAYECDGALTTFPMNYPGHVSVPLIRKPE